MNTLSFRNIKINRMPGVENLELDALCLGINVVYGANAAGKSSLARALCDFWSTEKPDKTLHLEALVHLGTDELELEIYQGKQRCSKFGKETDILLSSAAGSWAYIFELADLLTSKDERIAEEILRQLLGGLDITSACRKLSFAEKPKSPHGIKKEAIKADDEYKKAKKEQIELEIRSGKLEELEEKSELAASADRLLGTIQSAIDLQSAVEKSRDAHNALDLFDPRISKFHGNEMQNLENLQKQLDSIEIDLQQNTKLIAESEQELEELGRPEELDQNLAQQHIFSLRSAEMQLKEISSNLSTRLAKRQVISPTVPEDLQSAAFDVQNLPDLLKRVKECISLQQKFEGLKIVDDWVGPLDTAGDIDQLRTGIAALRKWLSSGEVSFEPPNGVWYWVSLISVGLSSVLSAFLHWAFFILTFLGLAAVYVLVRSNKKESKKPVYGEEYNKTELPQPSKWDSNDVERLLMLLEKELAEQETLQAKRDRWLDTKNRLYGIGEEYAFSKAELNQEAQRLGVELPENEISALLFLDAVMQYRNLSLEIADFSAQQETLQQTIASKLTELSKLLDMQITDSTMAEISVSRRVEIINQYSSAKEKLKVLKRETRNLDDRKNSLQCDMDSLFGNLEITVGDFDSFSSLFEKLDEWKLADEKYKYAKSVVNDSAEKLHNNIQALNIDRSLMERLGLPISKNALQKYLKNAELDELQSVQDTLQEMKSQRPDIIENIQKIKSEIDLVKKNQDLERLAVERDKSRDKLRNERKGAVESSIGWILADYLRRSTADNTNFLLKEAKKMFEKITLNQYQLLFDEREKALAAKRCADSKTLSLDQLSSGTRAQLWIAARMAYIRSQETDHAFPLVMDESLANSDDARAEQIIQAICEVAKESRQIFYFTAQSDEVEKWTAVTARKELEFLVHKL